MCQLKTETNVRWPFILVINLPKNIRIGPFCSSYRRRWSGTVFNETHIGYIWGRGLSIWPKKLGVSQKTERRHLSCILSWTIVGHLPKLTCDLFILLLNYLVSVTLSITLQNLFWKLLRQCCKIGTLTLLDKKSSDLQKRRRTTFETARSLHAAPALARPEIIRYAWHGA